MSGIDRVLGPGFGGLPEKAKLERAAHELESVVLKQLFAAMRETVPKGGLFEESASQEIFQSMLDEELARASAAKSPFGLAEAVMKQLGGAFQDGAKVSEVTAVASAAAGANAALAPFRRIG